ncbi:serine/threonine-protein kinase [Metabacillus sp. GX 13764]|uniref:serine/threonine-protein kinase n=1 Tax=Metabacillus kandeliae TaxID=2900151 RepID=UPI001E44DE61|nr:serine/threonine-protein kinase [Metabacillus kandeliae]MCD7036660.1 serine/threonine-protein kinase [Metabacillus kandeliae]
MNHTTANQACKAGPGTIVTGKWHSNTYEIVRPLGHGANGIVYLAKGKGGYSALKLSENSLSITSEVNVLKTFSKAQGSSLGPFLLDTDDWIRPGRAQPIAFYAMEYIQGKPYLDFIKGKGSEWIAVLMLQLLSNLQELHEGGWVFGDLKPENLIVSPDPVKIRFVDVGGTTIKGRAVKEFTDFFDRGYWGLGDRKADERYDLFAVSMIIINSVYPKRFSRNGDSKQLLSEKIEAHPFLKKQKRLLWKGLYGEYISAEEMRHDMLDLLQRSETPPVSRPVTPVKKQAAKKPEAAAMKRSTRRKKKNKLAGLLEGVLVMAGLAVLCMMYYFHILLP